VSILEGFVLAVHTKAVSQISLFEDKVRDNKILLKDFTDIYAQGRSMTIYHVLFIASQFFQLVICIDAVREYKMFVNNIFHQNLYLLNYIYQKFLL
jgi:hypothetical protein